MIGSSGVTWFDGDWRLHLASQHQKFRVQAKMAQAASHRTGRRKLVPRAQVRSRRSVLFLQAPGREQVRIPKVRSERSDSRTMRRWMPVPHAQPALGCRTASAKATSDAARQTRRLPGQEAKRASEQEPGLPGYGKFEVTDESTRDR